MIDRISPTANRRRASDSGRTRFPKFRRASLPETVLAQTVARTRSSEGIAGGFRPAKALRDCGGGIPSYGGEPPSKRNLRGSRADDRRSGRRYLEDPASASNVGEAGALPHGFSRFFPNPAEGVVRPHRLNLPVATVIAARSAPLSRPRIPLSHDRVDHDDPARLFSRDLRQAI